MSIQLKTQQKTETVVGEILLPQKKTPVKVCFVDLFDTGSAPMAKWIASKMGQNSTRSESINGETNIKTPPFLFFSRGLNVTKPQKMRESAKKLLEEHGIVPGEHTSTPFAPSANAEFDFDVVILLRRSYALDLMLTFPEVESKTTFFSVDVPEKCGETTYDILERELKLFYENYRF